MSDAPEPCDRCGETEGHTYTEGDCLLPHRHDGRRHPPQASIGHCCKWCVDRHATWLTEITELYSTLWRVLEPGSLPEEPSEWQKPKKQPAAPAPIRLDAWALLRDAGRLYARGSRSDMPDIPAVLCGWAQNTLDAKYDNATVGTTLSAAVSVLVVHGEFIATVPWVDEYDAELRWVRQALRRAHGISGGRKPVGRCPSLTGNGQPCGGPLWADVTGPMQVQCGDCDRIYDERFLRHLGGMIETA